LGTAKVGIFAKKLRFFRLFPAKMNAPGSFTLKLGYSYSQPADIQAFRKRLPLYNQDGWRLQI